MCIRNHNLAQLLSDAAIQFNLDAVPDDVGAELDELVTHELVSVDGKLVVVPREDK